MDDAAAELGEPAPAEPAVRLQGERGPGGRPQLGAEDAEGEVGVRHEAGHDLPPCSAVAVGVPVELGRVPVGVGGEERGDAVGVQRPGRMLGVQILEPVGAESLAELRMGRPADPEGMPRAEHVVDESRLGELRSLDRAAELVVRFEDANAPAAAGEKRSGGE